MIKKVLKEIDQYLTHERLLTIIVFLLVVLVLTDVAIVAFFLGALSAG